MRYCLVLLFLLVGCPRPTPDCLDINGCQNEAPAGDEDGDSLDSSVDRCPLDTEDFDGFQDHDGCPDPDNDADGILDVQDKCPNVPEDRDAFEDQDGCPDPDNDQDGVVDSQDMCPNEPQLANNPKQDGCPHQPPVIVKIVDPVPVGKVFFSAKSAKIDPATLPLIDDVAVLLKTHPEILKIKIVGHSFQEGDAAAQKKLSEKRAIAVRDELVERGIAAERLEVFGNADASPLTTGQSKEEVAKNRRVEFEVVTKKD